jgi:comEA protein
MRKSFWLLVGLGTLLAAASTMAGADHSVALEGVVNINTASLDELELLPGVGPSKARLIAAYRQQHPFRTVEELARVKGIGPKTVRRLRAHLVVRGPTTAQPPSRRHRPEPDAISTARPPSPPLSPPATASAHAPSATAGPRPRQATRPVHPPSTSDPTAPRCASTHCLPPP